MAANMNVFCTKVFAGISLPLILGLYLIIINLVGLLMMKVDKTRAIAHKWRIPEKSLFLVALLGGSVGAWAGMYLFHHKTKHWYFVIGMPLILVIQIAVWILSSSVM